jgi:hypothetical protein
MNNPVDHIVEEAEKLPYDQINALLERLRAMLDERDRRDEQEWDALTSRPGAKELMGELGDKAWEEHLAGKTREGGFGRD